MIDHVSVEVGDLEQAIAFYTAVLGAIGYSLLVQRNETAGFGKTYPEFWINLRRGDGGAGPREGSHVALRCAGAERVRDFHKAALANGGSDAGGPGPRVDYSTQDHTPYAAFIRDPDGNRVEAVTFLAPASHAD